MKVIFVSILAVLQLTGALGFDTKCPFHPSLWCSSYDIATACGVTRQCLRTEWSPSLGVAPLVNFTLYYESLCPDCQNFIKTQLYPAFQAVGSIVNLTLIPYGNAQEKRVGDKWEFKCQHGVEECIGNILDTCLLNIVKDINKTFPFIHCMEVSGQHRSAKAFEECSKKFPSIPVSSVQQCAKSKQGNEWEHEMAVRTEALNPPHQYVPWVTLNGVHNEAIQNKAEQNLLQLLCDTYTGQKPPGCQQEKNIPYKRGCQK